MMDHATVQMELERDEALALFDLLAREIDDGNGARLKSLISHDGELWALNGLHARLERALSEPFEPDYEDRLVSAKNALVERSGAWPD